LGEFILLYSFLPGVVIFEGIYKRFNNMIFFNLGLSLEEDKGKFCSSKSIKTKALRFSYDTGEWDMEVKL
jgi:hypothetical protein